MPMPHEVDRSSAPAGDASRLMVLHPDAIGGMAPCGWNGAVEVRTMAVRSIAHPGVDDRRAKGSEARNRTPFVQPRRVEAGRRPPRPGRVAGGAGRHP